MTNTALQAFRLYGDLALQAACCVLGGRAGAEDAALQVFLSLRGSEPLPEPRLKAHVLREVLRSCAVLRQDTPPEANAGTPFSALPAETAEAVFLAEIAGYTVAEAAALLERSTAEFTAALEHGRALLEQETPPAAAPPRLAEGVA